MRICYVGVIKFMNKCIITILCGVWCVVCGGLRDKLWLSAFRSLKSWCRARMNGGWYFPIALAGKALCIVIMILRIVAL